MPDHYNRWISPEEQRLYDHLLYCVKVELPDELIERFRSLFINGIGYPEPKIWAALEKILASTSAEQEFKFVLNRCCHILINSWQQQPRLKAAIPKLIALFEIPSGAVRHQATRRLRELVKLFTQSEQYLTLRRLAQVMQAADEGGETAGTKPLGTLIRRYPYLYRYCLLSEDSVEAYQQTVEQIQIQAQRQFEVELSEYITNQVQRSQNTCETVLLKARGILPPVKNPTLLSNCELNTALKEFAGKVDGFNTRRELAQQFLKHNMPARSFRVFKEELHEYLVASINPEYGKHQFNRRLYAQLQNILPESDAQRPSDFLLLRTCTKLLNFLVTESSQRPEHYIFLDLTENIGTTATISLLLKIVLLCRQVRYHLEKRFSILFNHFEAYSGEGVNWLVQSLETLNIALTTHFGQVDISKINQIC